MKLGKVNPLIGLAVVHMEHGPKEECDCCDKSKQKLRRGFAGTNHIEAISFPCRVVVSVIEQEQHGEGSKMNLLQLQMLIHFDFKRDKNATFPIRLFIDDACSTLVHLNAELGRYVSGEATVLEPWILFMLVAIDICVDSFHIRNHVEFWCKRLLHPVTRKMPENWNTQAGEQNFQEIVRYAGSLEK